MARTIIQSRKHINQFSPENVAFGGIANKTIAVALQNADEDQAVQCSVGTIIEAVYLEVWASGDGSTQSSATFTFLKRPGGAFSMTNAQSADLHTYINKNNILYMHQGLFPDNSENPRLICARWFKIPKGKQRMALSDTLAFTITGLTDGITFCGFSVWKGKT